MGTESKRSEERTPASLQDGLPLRLRGADTAFTLEERDVILRRTKEKKGSIVQKRFSSARKKESDTKRVMSREGKKECDVVDKGGATTSRGGERRILADATTSPTSKKKGVRSAGERPLAQRGEHRYRRRGESILALIKGKGEATGGKRGRRSLLFILRKRGRIYVALKGEEPLATIGRQSRGGEKKGTELS